MLLQPFVPSGYSLKSPKEFIDILNTTRPEGIIASLDVESLFTNVPVNETIDLILDEVYRSDKTPLDIPENLLKELLMCCTKEAPFRAPNGLLYKQIDGVAMGSPLGVLFTNFYMGCLERKVLNENADHPSIYARYIDDIFVNVSNESHLQRLQEALQSESCLRFTTELQNDQTLPFLDVLVTNNANKFISTVYAKKTNLGFCLNAASECPKRYLNSVITSYVNRAFSHCSTWALIHKELERISQVLVNNGYKNSDIQNAIKRKMDSFMEEENK